MARLLIIGSLVMAIVFSAATAYGDVEAGVAALDQAKFKQARDLLRQPAADGDPRAQFLYGRLLLLWADMDGVAWIRRAAQAGYLPAQVRMADFPLYAMYMPRDREASVEWLLAADAHDRAVKSAHPVESARAQLLLATAYEFGLKVPKDFHTSIALLEDAARQGNVWAQLYMGRRLEQGNGVDRDLVAAHTHYVLAWKQGNTDAKKKALAVRKRITSDQLDASKAQVREYLRKRAGGELGAAFLPDEKLSKGQARLRHMAGMQDKLHSLLTSLAFNLRDECPNVWLRSRAREELAGPRFREHWVYEGCGAPKTRTVTFTDEDGEIGYRVSLGPP